MNLVKDLVGQLGVDEKQASGGLGLLLNFAKDKLCESDFLKVSEALPETEQLIEAAPTEEAEEDSGLLGTIGGLVSSLGGESELGDLGSLASLAGSFSKLGIDMETISKFLPIVIAFFQGKGVDSLKDLVGDYFCDNEKETE